MSAQIHHNGTIKTVAEIYGFDQVIIIGKKEGQSDFVASYGTSRQSAGYAQRLGEYLEYKLKQWADCGMDQTMAPPPGAAS